VLSVLIRQEKEREQEYDFLQEICVSVLNADKKISFTAVVDSIGKLLVGKCRENTRKIVVNSCYIKPTFFHSYLLASGLEKWKAELPTARADMVPENKKNDKLHFNLLEIKLLKLAITPLTKRGDVYLCVYMEPSASCQQIISKICKAISYHIP
jgi:hypothetical protein